MCVEKEGNSLKENFDFTFAVSKSNDLRVDQRFHVFCTTDFTKNSREILEEKYFSSLVCFYVYGIWYIYVHILRLTGQHLSQRW